MNNAGAKKTAFGSLSLDEQSNIVTQIGEMLKTNELMSIKPSLYREEVAKLSEQKVEGKMILSVDGALPISAKDKVAKFQEEVKQIQDQYEGINIKVSAALGVGDDYKLIENVTPTDNAENFVAINHEPGQVLMIDFWASWCPPCQKPMAHNQEMVEKHAAEWAGKVRIIGVSIDKDAQTVHNHIEKNGWGSVEHYHRAKSTCSDDYEVRGVPHILIVGPDGKIVFKGHPAGRQDLVQDFNDLLAGKGLSGAEGGETVPEPPKNPVDMAHIASVMSEMERFNKEVGPELQKKCKTNASGMMRDFSVLTLSAKYHPNSNQWESEYINHRVLVGTKEKLDFCKSAIEEAMGGGNNEKGFNFTVKEMCQEM